MLMMRTEYGAGPEIPGAEKGRGHLLLMDLAGTGLLDGRRELSGWYGAWR